MDSTLDLEAQKERFKSLLLSTHRQGIDKLVSWLDTTDFYEAPSSTIYHSNFKGGLVAHTLSVYDIAEKIYKGLTELSSDLFIENHSIIIATLLHDLCKVNMYKSKTSWKKDESNNWISYPGYEVSDEFPYGHGEKSVYLCNYFIRLSKEEALAIRWHMGNSDSNAQQGTISKYAFSNAMDKSKLLNILMAADNLSSQIIETSLKF